MDKEFLEALPLHPELHHKCSITTEMNPFDSVIFDVIYLNPCQEGCCSCHQCLGCGEKFLVRWPE